MRISHLTIKNFRNFHNLDIDTGNSLVILGENQIGKTNLLYALRLVLDPTLPDSARQLKEEDFWDGLSRDRPLAEERILISVDLTDFEEDENHLAVLAEHLISPEPMTARLTYEFCPIHSENGNDATKEYEFFTYGGERQENRFGYELRKWIPLEVLPALRDAEGDLERWSRSPLKPLIERAKSQIGNSELISLANSISEETKKVAEVAPLLELTQNINTKLRDMAGSEQAIETSLGFTSTDPEKLLRTIRLLFDNKNRDVSDASLGTANVLYLALRSLELDALSNDEKRRRNHTFLGIEEPEAHLHPHLQRLIYRNYLRPRKHQEIAGNRETPSITYLLTTHSPHIASVSPIESLVLLKKDPNDTNATIGVSGASIELTESERNDIERYLDVTRAECLFGRGVILVEGDAEKFLVPVFASKLGHDLDALGITVCSVGGVHFGSHVKFLGPSGLDIPFSIITDKDEINDENGQTRTLGDNRTYKLCKSIQPDIADADNFPQPERKKLGVFCNASTLEIELCNVGCMGFMSQVMQEIGTNNAAKKRFTSWENNNTEIDEERLLKDIKEIGKGRFAQRLCAILNENEGAGELCPSYIEEAIEYVVNKIK